MPENSLEHYGVKGMKWGESKRKKNQKDYASTSFWDISPVELPAWRKAQQEKKKIDSSKPSYTPPPMPKKKSGLSISIDTIKKRLKVAKRWLQKLCGKPVGKISSETTSIGRGAINGVLKALQRNSK